MAGKGEIRPAVRSMTNSRDKPCGLWLDALSTNDGVLGVTKFFNAMKNRVIPLY
jgi:hypothetical protein